MKKLFKFFVATAIIAVGFMGCSEETPVPTPDPIPTPNQESGIPTYATFTFKINDGASTKALVTDGYEGAVPSTFYDVRLLVFDYQADGSGICEANELVTNAAGTQAVSKTVRVRSGNKLLLVLANAAGKAALSSKFSTIKVSSDPLVVDNTATTYNQFLANFNELDLGTGTPVTDVTFSDLVKTASTLSASNNLVFSNGTSYADAVRFLNPNIGEDASKNGTGDDRDVNHFEIALQRTVGKAIAYVKGLGESSTDVATTDAKGALDNLYYNIQNVNRSVKIFQVLNTAAPYKPIAPYFNLWDATTATQAETDSGAIFTPYFYRNYTVTDVNHQLKFTNNFDKSAPVSYSIYVTENANNRTFAGLKTYFAIKGRYTPKAGTVFIIGSNGVTNFDKTLGQFTLATTTSFTKGDSFWRLHDKFFGTENGDLTVVGGVTSAIPKDVLFLGGEADSLAIKKVLYIIEKGDTVGFGAANTSDFLIKDYKEYIQYYDEALCYYRLNIRQGLQTETPPREYVIRNNWYQAGITSFTGLGSPSLEDLDDGSGDEDTTPTYVTAEFTITDWVDQATVSDVPPWEP